jgi:two-component system response regulator CpxR
MPPEMTHSKTVLLVEDDLAIRDALQDQLERDGYDVVPATNGKQAIDYLDADTAPDLIILDLMTPIVTGWQVLERLRANPALARIPVIVVTAIGSDKPSGAAAVLRKPFRLDTLRDAVRTYLA